jgi:hypothetical protein
LAIPGRAALEPHEAGRERVTDGSDIAVIVRGDHRVTPRGDIERDRRRAGRKDHEHGGTHALDTGCAPR